MQRFLSISSKRKSILIINPNTTKIITETLETLIASCFHQTQFTYFTASSGVPSINNEEDAVISSEACLPALKDCLEDFDGFLVCCYSQHPLVSQLRGELMTAGLHGKVVAGIFEASVAACIQSLNVDTKFGIVSTGKQWKDILEDAVSDLLGSTKSLRYAGTETTGLNADELHTAPKDEIDLRVKEGTRQVLRNGAKAICLGCAGMSWMHDIVRQACIEYLGESQGREIKIIDGVMAGVVFLEGALQLGW